MKTTMRNLVLGFGLVCSAMMFAGQASAQSGHFLDAQCTDEGTILLCTGKVAGLGSATFEITVEVDGQAIVECTNQGGNIAPGQTKDISLEGTTGSKAPTRNGQFRFTDLTTIAPAAPARSCPNTSWTGSVTDVVFATTATLTLFEGGAVSDSVTVTIQ